MRFVPRDQERILGPSSREACPAELAHETRAPDLRPRTAANSRLEAISNRPAAEPAPAQAQSRRAPRRSRISKFHFHAYPPLFFASPLPRRANLQTRNLFSTRGRCMNAAPTAVHAGEWGGA